jgi:hypothetical protein
MYWKITPYHNRDADFCVMPGDTEEDHRAALEYAQDRLEVEWDEAKPGKEPTPVTIQLCRGNYREDLLI